MAHDSAATRARLLDAAFAEFAERGLAGARVDRIAAEASANKRAIYDYFGSKEQLFDAVQATRCGTLMDSVPFDARDLPGYAAGVFDHLAGQPALMRMVLWKQLERPEQTDHERTVYGRIVDALVTTYDLAPGGSSAQAAERAQDLLFAVLGLATAPFTLAPSAAQPARSSERSVQQRQDLHRAVSTIAANLTLRAGARSTSEG